jgi:hypothetical protein
MLGRNHAEQEPRFGRVTVVRQDFQARPMRAEEIPGSEGAPRGAAQRFVRD